MLVEVPMTMLTAGWNIVAVVATGHAVVDINDSLYQPLRLEADWAILPCATRLKVWPAVMDDWV